MLLRSQRENLKYLWPSQILLALKVHDEHVGRLHELFLHAAGRNVDLVFMADTRASAGSCHLARYLMLVLVSLSVSSSCSVRREGCSYPAQGVELCAERANVVCGVVGVVRVHECLDILCGGGHFVCIVKYTNVCLRSLRFGRISRAR
jgi:hypothetical protein